MIPALLLPHRLTWQRPGSSTDAYGNTAPDWSAPSSKVIAGRLIQDNTSQGEETYGRQDVAAGWKLLTNELGIGPADRLVQTVDGKDVTFEVVGQPYRVAGLSKDHHAEVRLRAVVTG